MHHGTNLHAATVALRRNSKKLRIQKETINWGMFVVSEFAHRDYKDLIPVAVLFEVVFSLLVIPLVVNIVPKDVGTKHWHTRTVSSYYRMYTIDGTSCVIPPGIGALLIDFGVYYCRNNSTNDDDIITTRDLLYHLHLNEVHVENIGIPLLDLLRSTLFAETSSLRAALVFLLREVVALGLFSNTFPAEEDETTIRKYIIPSVQEAQKLQYLFSKLPCHQFKEKNI